MASRRALLLVVLCAAALCAAATAVEDRTAAAAIVARPRPEEQAPILLEQGAGEDDFDKCKTCIFVIERIKKGTNMLLPSICAEIFEKFPKGTAYADVSRAMRTARPHPWRPASHACWCVLSQCHQTLNALSTNGNNVRYVRAHSRTQLTLSCRAGYVSLRNTNVPGSRCRVPAPFSCFRTRSSCLLFSGTLHRI